MNTLLLFGTKYLYLFIIAIAIVYFALQPRKKQKDIIILSTIYLPLSYIFAKIIGYFYYNPRPFVIGHFQPLVAHIADNGFPSDHMLLSSAIASILFIYNKKIGLLAWIIAFFVGLSRVSAGLHHWTDIIGSALIAILVMLIVKQLYAVGRFAFKVVKHVVRFTSSIFLSIRRAIILNPDVQRLSNRYPRCFSFLGKRMDRASFFGLPVTLILISFAYVFFLFFSTVQDVVTLDQGADLRIASLLTYFRNPEFTKIFLWITLLGKWQIVAGSALAVSAILWIWKKRDYILYVWLALGIGELSSYLGKLAVHRPRPENPVYIEDSFSFPSGHAMISVVFYGFLGYLLIRRLKGWKQKAGIFFICFIIAIAIGFSRLYLGVHYLSDIWAGYLLGLLILTTIITFCEWRRFKRKKAPIDAAAATRIRKIVTAAVALMGVAWYIGFGLSYRPQFFVFAAPSMQYVSGDIAAYFSSHGISKYSETLTGSHQEPLSFIFLAKSDDALVQSFERASWFLADQVNTSSIIKIAKAALGNSQYLNAPMTPSFWNGSVNDFGFEKATSAGTVRQRHHIRIWKTNLKQNGYLIYVGTASFDKGIKWFITHKISPDIDTERTFVKENLQSTGAIENVQEIQFVKPVLGANFSNDPFFTYGRTYIIVLK
jgi:undecaprenyl-diphosphatase